jgi:pimeloyl-ACP methyl ester carboxylesterase
MMSTMKEQVLRVEGQDIYCKTILHHPENKTIILVHGASANADAWMPVIPHFNESVNIIALDMPGHYRSKGTPKQSIEEMATFINSFVEEAISLLHLKGNIVYVGHSLGGGIGIELGIRKPEWLKELILVTTSANLNVLEPEFLEKLKQGEMDKSFFIRGFSPSTPIKFLSMMLQRQGTTSIEASLRDFVAGSKFNRMNDLQQITARTLIISGKDDQIMQKDASEILHKGIPNSTLVEVENAGHFITLEHPQKVARIILDFIA